MLCPRRFDTIASTQDAAPVDLVMQLTAISARSRYERIAAAVAVSLAAFLWVYSAHAIFAYPPPERVQFVPDDAYYYLALARNFVNQGQWSFDSGVSVTTGFHPLHAYALAAVYSLTHATTERFVDYGLMLSFLAAVPAFLLAMLFSVRAGRLLIGLVLLLFVLSKNVSLNTVSAMEWSWVVSLSAFYCLAFWRLWRVPSMTTFAAIIVVAFLGSLARTDFGLLPAALAAAALPSVRRPAGRVRFAGAVAGLAAACFGVACTLGHNYAVSGQFLQSSARMKLLWLGACGPSPVPIAGRVLTLFGSASWPTVLLASIVILGALIYGTCRFMGVWCSADRDNRADSDPDQVAIHAVLWFGSLATLTAYIVFYSFNPAGMQPWYTAGLIVPLLLFLSLPFSKIRVTHPLHLAVLTVLLVLVARQSALASVLRATPPWPHQVSMLHAGLFLQKLELAGKCGSWNAGIIGYYEGGHVVNLDGLVNNDIFQYAKENKLGVYIDERRIVRIVDFAYVLEDAEMRRRGGVRGSGISPPSDAREAVRQSYRGNPAPHSL